jgi:hypothetical protein
MARSGHREMACPLDAARAGAMVDLSHPTNFQGDPMPLINVRVIENVFTTELKRSVQAEQPKPGGRPTERRR